MISPGKQLYNLKVKKHGKRGVSRLARKAAQARNDSLTAERRSEIARLGAITKHEKWLKSKE